jgi:transcription elongation factor GreA
MKFQNQPKAPPIPLTQEELDKKKKELAHLLKTQEEILVRLADAREMGDLSENGAYSAAKHELGTTRRQLKNVNHILKYGYVPQKTTQQTAHFGSLVTIKNDRTEMTFTLVSQYESNLQEKKLSLESPIGKAVSGKKVGEQIAVITPSGSIEYTIIAIK